jgi:hypothetical protein
MTGSRRLLAIGISRSAHSAAQMGVLQAILSGRAPRPSGAGGFLTNGPASTIGGPRSRCEGGIMNDSSLARLVVTVIVLVGFAVWLKVERTELRSCGTNCPTDISASHR